MTIGMRLSNIEIHQQYTTSINVYSLIAPTMLMVYSYTKKISINFFHGLSITVLDCITFNRPLIITQLLKLQNAYFVVLIK
jgi:hypothetical protein